MNSAPEKTCRRLLLGIASEEEEIRVEDAVLSGELDALFLQNVEDGLIDEYLLGSMTQEERHGFLTHFLATEERKQRLAFASALIEYARKQPVQEHSTSRNLVSTGVSRAALSWKESALLAVAASILLATLAGFEQIQLRRETQIATETQNDLTRLRALMAAGNSGASRSGEQATGSPSSLHEPVDQMPTIELATSTRGVNPALLRVPVKARLVRIDVNITPPLAMKYREVIVASNGFQLWAQEFPASILPATHESNIVLPASILHPGTYHLLLERASAEDHYEESGDWVFRVAKE